MYELLPIPNRQPHTLQDAAGALDIGVLWTFGHCHTGGPPSKVKTFV